MEENRHDRSGGIDSQSDKRIPGRKMPFPWTPEEAAEQYIFGPSVYPRPTISEMANPNSNLPEFLEFCKKAVRTDFGTQKGDHFDTPGSSFASEYEFLCELSKNLTLQAKEKAKKLQMGAYPPELSQSKVRNHRDPSLDPILNDDDGRLRDIMDGRPITMQSEDNEDTNNQVALEAVQDFEAS